jgi:hypothetical protein
LFKKFGVGSDDKSDAQINALARMQVGFDETYKEALHTKARDLEVHGFIEFLKEWSFKRRAATLAARGVNVAYLREMMRP